MNLPNKLSLLRICLVPLFVVAYFLPYAWGAYVAVALFIIAAATDFLDGYIARKYNMVTDLGKLLDPIADKILVCAALFCVVATNPMQYLSYLRLQWATTFGVILLAVGATVILARELLVSAVRQIAATKGVVVQANFYGKIKTIFQDVSLPMIVVLNGLSIQAANSTAPLEYNSSLFWIIWWWVAVALFVLAVVLTIVSGAIYLKQNRKVFSSK